MFDGAFANGVFPETHVLHTGCSSRLTPVNASLVVIVDRCGSNVVFKADIKTAEANGEDFFGTFVGGTNFSFT